jgi:hypothetical protein
MDTVTYPDTSVQAFIAGHFVPVKLMLNRAEDRGHFRTHRVIWTPSTVVLDRHGAAQYQSPGFPPPQLFLQMLHIGLARGQLAWARYEDAAAHLTVVAEDAQSVLAPEALYWLGIARFLGTRSHDEMMGAWNRLRNDYPSSIWAAHVPPED